LHSAREKYNCGGARFWQRLALWYYFPAVMVRTACGAQFDLVWRRDMKNRNWSLMALGALAAGHTAHLWTLPLGVAASLVAAAGGATLSFSACAVA